MAETAGGVVGTGPGADPARLLTRRDVAASVLVGAVLAGTFWWLSPGWSLRVTFVPTVVVTVALVIWWARTEVEVPGVTRLLPAYCAALALQLLHFAEEYATGFAERFPLRYGGDPIDPTVFVAFNMTAYAVFLLARLGLTTGRGPRALIVPSLFYVVYGAIGNGFAHVAWAVEAGGYFPGLVTGTLYLVVGPALLKRYWTGTSWAAVGAACALLALVMLPPLLLVR